MGYDWADQIQLIKIARSFENIRIIQLGLGATNPNRNEVHKGNSGCFRALGPRRVFCITHGNSILEHEGPG